MFTPQTLQLPSFDDSESDDDRDDDYLDEQDFVVNEKEEELNESLLRRVTHATLRKELLDAGAPPSLLTLEVEPVAFDISRMMVELVSMLYKGQRCFMFALQPELHVDGSHDMNEAIRTLRVLSTLCNGAQGLSTFVGTGVYRDHVLYAQHCHDGATLKMLIMSVSDGDVRTSPSLQLALATDLAMAVKVRISQSHNPTDGTNTSYRSLSWSCRDFMQQVLFTDRLKRLTLSSRLTTRAKRHSCSGMVQRRTRARPWTSLPLG